MTEKILSSKFNMEIMDMKHLRKEEGEQEI